MSEGPARLQRWSQLRRLLLTLGICLLVILMAMWFRSYRVTDAWSYRHTHTADGGTNVRMLGIWWARGSLVLHHDTWRVVTHAPHDGSIVRWTRHPPSTAAEGLVHINPQQLPLGFAYASETDGASSTAIALPAWAPVVALALPVAWCGRGAYVRRRRSRLGLCARCGYDLRASGEKCPECGADIPTPSLPPARAAATPH
jgi:hypothetical protein